MSSVAEIEQAITGLSPSDFVKLGEWFDEQRNRQWDSQIEEDAQNGKLDSFYKLMEAENQGQPKKGLNAFLDDQ